MCSLLHMPPGPSLRHTLLLGNECLQALALPCGSHRNVAAEVEAKRWHQVKGEVDDEAEVEDATQAHQEVGPPLPAQASLQEGDHEPHVDANDQHRQQRGQDLGKPGGRGGQGNNCCLGIYSSKARKLKATTRTTAKKGH